MNNYNKKIPLKYFIPLYGIFLSLLLFLPNDNTINNNFINIYNLNRVFGISVSLIFMMLFFVKIKKIYINKMLLLLIHFIFLNIISMIAFSKNVMYDIWNLLETFTLIAFISYSGIIIINYPNYFVDVIEKTIIFIKFLLFSVFLSIILFPEKSIVYLTNINEQTLLNFRIQGIITTINPISVGTLSAVLLIWYLLKFINNNQLKIYDCFFVILSLVLLLLSQSRTIFVSMFFSIIIYFLFTKKISLLNKIFIFILVILFLLLFYTQLEDLIVRGDTKNLYTLSGRTYWWLYSYNLFIHSDIFHKLIGFGYASGERFIASEASNGLMKVLDSSWISLLISNGILGLMIYIILFGYLLLKFYILIKKTTNFYIHFLFLILLIIVFKSFTTTIIYYSYYLYFIIIIIIGILYGKEIRKESK